MGVSKRARVQTTLYSIVHVHVRSSDATFNHASDSCISVNGSIEVAVERVVVAMTIQGSAILLKKLLLVAVLALTASQRLAVLAHDHVVPHDPGYAIALNMGSGVVLQIATNASTSPPGPAVQFRLTVPCLRW